MPDADVQILREGTPRRRVIQGNELRSGVTTQDGGLGCTPRGQGQQSAVGRVDVAEQPVVNGYLSEVAVAGGTDRHPKVVAVYPLVDFDVAELHRAVGDTVTHGQVV